VGKEKVKTRTLTGGPSGMARKRKDDSRPKKKVSRETLGGGKKTWGRDSRGYLYTKPDEKREGRGVSFTHKVKVGITLPLNERETRALGVEWGRGECLGCWGEGRIRRKRRQSGNSLSEG